VQIHCCHSCPSASDIVRVDIIMKYSSCGGMLRPYTAWNSLPSLVRTADSFTSFRSQLKMFARQFCSRSAVRVSDNLTRSFARYKLLLFTYLLTYLLQEQLNTKTKQNCLGHYAYRQIIVSEITYTKSVKCDAKPSYSANQHRPYSQDKDCTTTILREKRATFRQKGQRQREHTWLLMWIPADS